MSIELNSVPIEVTARSKPVAGATQRVLDILIALAALCVLFPLFLIIAIAIKLNTPGPVLFKQRRVGLDGQEFWLYKFRSMVTNAEPLREALALYNEAHGPLFKIKDDPRITRVGRVLRRFSLDEFPQLINVLLGDMSMVGPRPALPEEVSQYTLRQRGRLAVLPGLTGLWQVSGRSDLAFERSIDLDLEYVDRKTVAMYWGILLRTIPAVISGRGAY